MKVPVTIKAVSICTGVPVPDAAVYVRENLLFEYKGKTDKDGNLYIGEYSPGRYGLKILSDRYVRSDEDYLQNDEFIIEEYEGQLSESDESTFIIFNCSPTKPPRAIFSTNWSREFIACEYGQKKVRTTIYPGDLAF